MANLERCRRRAKEMVSASESILAKEDLGLFDAQLLGAKVAEVLGALRGVFAAMGESLGRPLSDPAVKRLMRQSTTLAATLTQLILTVRRYSQP